MPTQLPSQQTNPDGQELPQAPQLLSLDERSTQNPPQSGSPREPQGLTWAMMSVTLASLAATVWQNRPTHASPAVQTLPKSVAPCVKAVGQAGDPLGPPRCRLRRIDRGLTPSRLKSC